MDPRMLCFLCDVSSILRLEQYGRAHSHVENVGQTCVEKNTNLANVMCLIRYNLINNSKKETRHC